MKPPASIDKGEVWACALGLDPVLAKAIPRVTAAHKRAVQGLNDIIAKQVNRLVTGKLDADYPDVPDYKDLSAALAVTFDADSTEAVMSVLPDDDKLPYLTVAQRQYEFMAAAIPRPVRETLVGTVPMPPDSTALYRFNGLYRVIDNPLYLLDLMGSGTVLHNQVHAVRIVFPTLTAYLDTAIRDAVIEQVTKDPDYTVPYLADSGIRDYLGMEQVYKPYQAAFIPPLEPDAGQKPSLPSSGVAPESKASLSSAQSALYGQVGR